MSKQTQSRAVQTKRPEKPRSAVMMAPRRSLVYLTRIEDCGWRRIENVGEGELPGEECPLIAHFSDGRIFEQSAFVYYQHGERERIFEAMVDERLATDDLVRDAQAVVLRRTKAVADVRAALQRQFGKPGAFHTCRLRWPEPAA